LTGGSGSAEDDLQLLRTRGAAQAAQGKERNTKVQARARCSGRLLAILLTGSESDGPVAERLIAIGKASQRPIGEGLSQRRARRLTTVQSPLSYGEFNESGP
jgi:hypothetical protein